MKTTCYTLLLLLTFTVFNCEKTVQIEYKYAEKPDIVSCNLDGKLIKEALYSFEEDIINKYAGADKNAINAYLQYVNRGLNDRNLKYPEFVSPHTIKVFEALQSQQDLWRKKGENYQLNYNGDLMNCIAKNISNTDLKTTLNALLTTNSMSSKLFLAPIKTDIRQLVKDNQVKTYIAFDLFYAKLFNVDFSKVEEKEAPATNVDFNKVPQKQQLPAKEEKDAHAGHNHE